MSTSTDGSQNAWERFCRWYKAYPSVGLAVDVSRMGFSEAQLEEFSSAAARALAEMEALESGAIANPDENRMVGHYWLRTPDLAPSEDLTHEIEASISAIEDFAEAVLSGVLRNEQGQRFERVLLAGIGGSALGPQLLEEVFSRSDRKLRLHFIDNTDPDGMERVLLELDDLLDRTLVLVVSKSGGTVETRNAQRVIEAVFDRKGLHFAAQAVAITVEGSVLDTQATQESWLRQFYLWDWVGGRTSIFSAVGLLPAALIGLDIRAFLAGAATMDAHTRCADIRDNPALLLAQMWYLAGDGVGAKHMVVLPYKDRLVLFSKYLQQLVMESLGKRENLEGEVVHQGLSVFGNKGSTDQHAYVQQLRDGRADFFVTFVEVLQRSVEAEFDIDGIEVDENVSCGDYLEGFYLGTRAALAEESRESISITVAKLDEISLGALIALYERSVGFYASFTRINAYHQPGVEAGKKAAASMITLQQRVLSYLHKAADWRSVAEISKDLQSEPESVYKLLTALSFKTGSGIRAEDLWQPDKSRFKSE